MEFHGHISGYKYDLLLLDYSEPSTSSAMSTTAEVASRPSRSISSSRSSSPHHDEREPHRHSSTWSNSLDPSNGATSAGQPSFFQVLNAAAQYSQIISEDTTDSDSEGVETPASEGPAADAPEIRIDSTEPETVLHKDGFPSPETALANLALHPHTRSRAGSTVSLQRFAHYAANITPELRATDLPSSEPLSCDKHKPNVSDHAVALKVLQYEFGELTLPGEIEEMILVSLIYVNLLLSERPNDCCIE